MTAGTESRWESVLGAVQAGGMSSDSSDFARDGHALVRSVTGALDPVLARFGFAAGQAGVDDQPRQRDPANPAPPIHGQIIFCRGFRDGSPGCEDVVVDLVADPSWHVRTVRDTEHSRGPWSVDHDDGRVEAVLARIVDDLMQRFDDS